MTGRWRLFPKYALLIITLVGGMLVASGAIGLYFSYRETEAHLVALQVEKAQSAATRIEQYVLDIEHQLSWTALPRMDSGGEALEQRRIEYLKLLRQAPAITEVAWIDGQGHEQLRVSRLAMDALSSGTDLSQEPKFRAAMGGRIYYGPVYFRKDTEPYMTIARPAGSGGGVTAAEVNLKFVWDVVSRIKIGAAGLAYVVDATGTLIAHPDISLVLKKSDLKSLPQVAALGRPADEASPVGRDLKGDEVFSAHAPIPTLRWTVFVESPRAEAFAPLYATLQRMALVLLAALLISIAASFFLARALVRPLRALQEGAAQIGAGDLDRRIEVNTGDELEGLAEQFNRMSAQLRESYAGLERKVEQRTAELTEALEYQTATAEILKVISNSPTDVQPILEAVAERSRLLCRAHGSRVWLLDGDDLRAVTGYKLEDGTESGRDELLPLSSASVTGRAFVEHRTVHVEDIAPLIDSEYPDSREVQARHGFRTVLAVPMLREGASVGIIAVLRTHVQPFSKAEIRLVETFADQALIAIENVRLFNETKEALEQQTATAEILRVISASITDTQPVFDAIVSSCQRLLGGRAVSLVLPRGTKLESVAFASDGTAEGTGGFLTPWPFDRDSGAGACILESAVIVVADTVEGATRFPRMRDLAHALGYRSGLFVPLLREGQAIGCFAVLRAAAGEFADKEISLAQTFADQAVIAIENVRLFNETREALEQQTATAEVLQVISGSMADARPVFDVILERCESLLADTIGSSINLIGDDGRVHTGSFRMVVVREPPMDNQANVDAMVRQLRARPPPPVAGSVTEAAIHAGRVLVHPDVLNGLDVPEGLRTTAQMIFGGKHSYSAATVPLLKDGRGLGSITVARMQLGGFSAKEQALLKVFADQAVVAIENARLFNETKEALDRQTATAEILRVISGSITDTEPVFDAIVRSCQKLFGGKAVALVLQKQAMLHVAASASDRDDDALRLPPWPADRGSAAGTSILESRLIVVEDTVESMETFPRMRQLSVAIGYGSGLWAPLLRDGRAVGCLAILREATGPFRAQEISLAQTFADQAVIAIENVRLFNETREALQQQTATAEVLQVISSSVADAAPVFDKILESCQRLFASSEQGVLLVAEDGLMHLGAHHGAARERLQKLFPVARDVGDEALSRARRIVHVKDVLNDADVPAGLRAIAESIDFGSYSQVIAPMMWEGESIGSLYAIRQPPIGFSDKEIGLLRTFADQAVIAIQNARLFNETKEALERQTATADILRVIAGSPADVRPVLEAIVQSAARLFGRRAAIRLVEDGLLRRKAISDLVPGGFDGAEAHPIDGNSLVGAVALERKAMQVEDTRASSAPAYARENAARLVFRSIASAPLLREDTVLGVLSVSSPEVGKLSEKQMAMLATFADQAVIAIQNARLFNETKEALEQQTATAEVLQVISSSVADAKPVFDKILDSCERLFAATGLGIYLIDDAEMLQMGAFRGDSVGAIAGGFPRRLEGTATAIAVRERRIVHYPDVLGAADAPALAREIAETTGNYSMAFAPMLWEERGVGVIQVTRAPPDPFTDKELALLKTFADQAVIAIQNARLFSEIQAKSREVELANKHKSEFLANMSHELRTPLNAIIGFSEVLSEKMFGEVNDKQLEYLLDIHTSGHHLLSLINDILDLSKIEAGRMELDLAKVDLPMLLDNCTTLVRERASRQGLVLALEVEGGVGEWVADVRKLKQVVINLLSNAVKFTPAGGRVTLRARQLERAVEIAVIDTGVGIARDQQALVFEEFRQAGGDYLRKSEGTGLGLSLSKRFVELHGGTIRVESEPGRGSTFALILPERVLESI